METDVSNSGLDLKDGGPPCFLHCADNSLCLQGLPKQLCYLLAKLVTCLGQVGLNFNAANTKVVTSQPQPPKTLGTRIDLDIGVLEQSSFPKWLGCMLSTANAGARQDHFDLRFFLPITCAAYAFNVHNCDQMLSIALFCSWALQNLYMILISYTMVFKHGQRNFPVESSRVQLRRVEST